MTFNGAIVIIITNQICPSGKKFKVIQIKPGGTGVVVRTAIGRRVVVVLNIVLFIVSDYISN